MVLYLTLFKDRLVEQIIRLKKPEQVFAHGRFVSGCGGICGIQSVEAKYRNVCGSYKIANFGSWRNYTEFNVCNKHAPNTCCVIQYVSICSRKKINLFCVVETLSYSYITWYHQKWVVFLYHFPCTCWKKKKSDEMSLLKLTEL